MKPKIEREPSASATPSHPQQPIIREFTLDLFAERSLISNEELQSILDHAKVIVPPKDRLSMAFKRFS